MHQDTAGGQSPGYKRRTSTRIQQEDKHQDTARGQAQVKMLSPGLKSLKIRPLTRKENYKCRLFRSLLVK